MRWHKTKPPLSPESIRGGAGLFVGGYSGHTNARRPKAEARKGIEPPKYSFADLTPADAAPTLCVCNMNGLEKLRRLRENLQAVPQIIPTIMGDAAVEYREEIIDLIHEQLEAGETPDDTPIRPAYANRFYAFKKNIKNPKPGLGNPDLKDTGAYYASFRLDVFNDGFEPYATDKKAPALEMKYGKVVAFSKSNIGRIREEIMLPALKRNIRKYL